MAPQDAARDRIRSQPSTIYREFQILYHPDSREWSFLPGPGAPRAYYRAQFSTRDAIDELLAAGSVREQRRGPVPLRTEPRTAEPPRVTGSDVGAMLGAVELPRTDVHLLGAGSKVSIRTFRVPLEPWDGPLPERFGLVPNKNPYLSDGAATYPELVVVGLFRAASWDARWRKNFGGAAWWSGLGIETPLTLPADQLFQDLQQAAYRLAREIGLPAVGGGAWDVLAWRDREFLFAEVKGAHEPMTRSQRVWLEAALRVGVPLSSFVVVRYS